ncbi:DUF6503 family protein [Pedobacter alpinus]|uniref:DUF6503 family protein n=1 Tax=Pedobacter alpinus TaxID=1590643 RepID=A0ABW5TW20_9SPHI
MQKKQLLIIAISLLLSACSFEPNADKIIKKSVAFYGMDKLDGKTVSFDFREKHFEIKIDDDDFFYESTYKDSLGVIKDQLSNHGFVRELNGLVTPLSAKDSLKYAESLNSVVYFAFLPLKLQDDAVEATFLRTVQVKGTEYSQIEVSFKKEDGGSHHNDVYYFWFDTKDSSMDYFAYSAGGNRFRAINGLVKVGNIYLQNYYNLENKGNDKRPLKDYHILFEQDKLSLLSEIKMENVKIN